MTFLLEQYNWIWLVAALVSGGLLLWPRLSGRQAGVSAPEAIQLINREKAVVVDVCEPAEFAAGHIVHARNVPASKLEEADSAKSLPTNKSLPLIVVCATGARAGRAATWLRLRGHEQVHVLAGGMRGWREAGLPVEKSAA